MVAQDTLAEIKRDQSVCSKFVFVNSICGVFFSSIFKRVKQALFP